MAQRLLVVVLEWVAHMKIHWSCPCIAVNSHNSYEMLCKQESGRSSMARTIARPSHVNCVGTCDSKRWEISHRQCDASNVRTPNVRRIAAAVPRVVGVASSAPEESRRSRL